MKYTRAQELLAFKAKAENSHIERNRWTLAKLADEAEQSGVDRWAEIIGAACRRSPKTVYEWRQAFVFRLSRNPDSRLDISFWITAAHAYDEADPAPVIDWLAVCEADTTITLESARANLPRKTKAEQPQPGFRDALLTVADAVADLAEHDDAPEIARMMLRSTADMFRRSVDAALVILEAVSDA